jgi:hypothetical protein
VVESGLASDEQNSAALNSGTAKTRCHPLLYTTQVPQSLLYADVRTLQQSRCWSNTLSLLLLAPHRLSPHAAVRVARAARLQSALEDRLAAIVQAVNDKREHIPPVVSAAVVTFPFDISIAGCVLYLHGFEGCQKHGKGLQHLRPKCG